MENVRLSLLQNIHTLELPSKHKTVYKRHGKPPYSYAGMIIVAIMRSPKRMLSLSQIHEYLRNMFDFFQQSYSGWKDSVRHNLSHCKCFVKGGKTPDGRNNLWTVNMSEVTPSLFRRQQTAIAKDGNYAEDLHDELQVPRIEIPFFNYSRGAPSKPMPDHTSSAASAIGSKDDNDVRTRFGDDGSQASSSSTETSVPNSLTFNNSGPSTPVLYRLPSGSSVNSPIILNSPDNVNTSTVRPPSALSASASSTALRSLSEHSCRCPSPAFSDITEPRTPDSDTNSFRPITEDLQPGWITPIGLVRDGSDLTRGASCLSDVSPSRSMSLSSKKVPKRKQVRHRPKVRKAMKKDTSGTSVVSTNSTFTVKTYADLQTLVTHSSDQWEVSIDKAIGNLHVLCMPSSEHTGHSPVIDTVYTSGGQSCPAIDEPTTFLPGNGNYYTQTYHVSEGDPATLGQTFGNPGSHWNDHTYSSPERAPTENKRQRRISETTTDNSIGVNTQTISSVDTDSNSLEEFADCALWYGLLG
ncbi:forkhead box protein B1-like [Ylistrum balloti]|uniref:forkhead box protein B1-like n=1 Tax=Ylistrum balloti TaxID=509963 RepID=UPI002905AA59|nr:forkhead box protein B1-like [Ylistrum balloti]